MVGIRLNKIAVDYDGLKMRRKAGMHNVHMVMACKTPGRQDRGSRAVQRGDLKKRISDVKGEQALPEVR